jgi:hypothetical protein
MSTRGSGPVTQLGCPTCGTVVDVRPSVAPGRSWVAVLPCPCCHAYAAHVVTAGGTPRSRLLDVEPVARMVGRSG